MKIEIKHRYDDKVIISGQYESVKDCLERNSDADLRGADLRGADLRYAYLKGSPEWVAKEWIEGTNKCEYIQKRIWEGIKDNF